MTITKTLSAAQLTQTLARSINELRLEAWPHLIDQPEGRQEHLAERWKDYHGPATEAPQWTIVLRGGEIVAAAHTFARYVACDERDFTVMGLASVCVRSQLRGHGLGSAVVQSALARVDSGIFQVSLFQTTLSLEPFYSRFGAVRAPNRFFNSYATDAGANPFWDPIVMRYPASSWWPISAIDLRGPAY